MELTVTVIADGREQVWHRVEDLACAGPEDAVYVVDSGGVRFGDGRQGRLPPDGSTVRVGHRDGSGAFGNIAGRLVVSQLYEFVYRVDAEPPGEIRQIMPAAGWFAVEASPAGEELRPLVGWALLEPYMPPYSSGGEPRPVTTQSVRGLVAMASEPVRIVDEQSPDFLGYRYGAG